MAEFRITVRIDANFASREHEDAAVVGTVVSETDGRTPAERSLIDLLLDAADRAIDTEQGTNALRLLVMEQEPTPQDKHNERIHQRT